MKKHLKNTFLLGLFIYLVFAVVNNKNNNTHVSKHSILNKKETIAAPINKAESSSKVAFINKDINTGIQNNEIKQDLDIAQKAKDLDAYTNKKNNQQNDCTTVCEIAKTERNFTSGYNESARYELPCNHFYATASYIYWQGIEDGLDPGIVNEGSISAVNTRRTIDMNFDFQSGFKLGFGGYLIDYDDW